MDLEAIAEELGVYDHNADHDVIIDSIARAGEYLADAVAAVTIGDRDYRQWRGKATLSALRAEPKLAEWKVRANVEARDHFKTFKTELAERQVSVDILRGYVDALKMRAASYE